MLRIFIIQAIHLSCIAYMSDDRSLVKRMSDHMFLMSGLSVPDSYLMADTPPVISILECNPQQWIRLA